MPISNAKTAVRPLRVAVAMSGGLDSAVAAALLKAMGHELIGLTAHLWREGSRCCAREDIAAAQAVAAHLDIRHYVIDALQDFGREVVEPFLGEYARGRTPSPCIVCNRAIKFGLLLRRARDLGCSHLATGHYARIEKNALVFSLCRGLDGDKDQSYYLHRLDQYQLAHTLFPLGEWNKKEVRAYARRRGLPVANRGESQDLCFVAPGELPDFIRARRAVAARPGPIESADGQVVGAHNGLCHFTIGQRKGLGLGGGPPRYVCRLDAGRNAVIVDVNPPLTRAFVAGDVHWIGGKPPDDRREYAVRVRYRQIAVPARLQALPGRRVRIELPDPVAGVAPGQAAVIYDGNIVLGGGWIE